MWEWPSHFKAFSAVLFFLFVCFLCMCVVMPKFADSTNLSKRPVKFVFLAVYLGGKTISISSKISFPAEGSGNLAILSRLTAHI